MLSSLSLWLTSFTILATIFVGLLYAYIKIKHTYWVDRNISGPTPLPFIGNIWPVLCAKFSMGIFLEHLYKSSVDRIMGIYVFDDPVLIIRCPQIAKQILIKDFDNFYDRNVAAPKHNDRISYITFFQKNPEWKRMRGKLSTVFTSGKIKQMFGSMCDVSNTMIIFLKKNDVHDVQNVALKYTSEAITRCFFGMAANCFGDKETEITKKCRDMFTSDFRNVLVQTIYFFKPILADIFRLEFFSLSVQKFFQKTVDDTLRSLDNQTVSSNIFVAFLKDIRNVDPTFDENKIVAQSLAIYSAGTGTTSSAIAFTLYELCLNATTQEKLRSEILDSLERHDGNLTYDCLNEMKYLDMCLQETLRKYPGLPFLDRRCNEEYQIAGTNLKIEKGTAVYISLIGIQNDPQYFPKPEQYIPERFESRVNSENLVYFPFGVGPRMCIGRRFALVVVKLAIVQILKNFELERTSATPNEIQFDTSVTLKTERSLKLKLKRLV